MKQAVVVIGTGEMGGVFARGFLKSGHPLIPINRNDDIQHIAQTIEVPALVLVAVGEKDLSNTLDQIPTSWKPQLALLQNELLPQDWLDKGITEPTIISVWFEKKPGQDFKILVPSPVFGPHSSLITEALSTLNIPTYQVADDNELLFELVRKNLYILTTNICGLETGGNVQQLSDQHADFMLKVMKEILLIQQYLTGAKFDLDLLFKAVVEAFDGDPEHQCMGRSAPQRLQRAIEIADKAGIDVPELTRIHQQASNAN